MNRARPMATRLITRVLKIAMANAIILELCDPCDFVSSPLIK